MPLACMYLLPTHLDQFTVQRIRGVTKDCSVLNMDHNVYQR